MMNPGQLPCSSCCRNLSNDFSYNFLLGEEELMFYIVRPALLSSALWLVDGFVSFTACYRRIII